MKILGSLRQVHTNKQVFKTAADASVKKVKNKSGRIRYRYASRHNAAVKRFDTKIKSGKYKGKTFRQMFKLNRFTPFKKGAKRSKDDNCKNERQRNGMLSRSSVLLREAYRNRKQTPVNVFGNEVKACKKKTRSKRTRTAGKKRTRTAGKKRTRTAGKKTAGKAPAHLKQWIDFVKKIQKQKKITFAKAMVAAKPLYSKKK